MDYIIVGSGAAGSVLAHRLSEDPECRVLVLEAGGPDDDEQLRAPAQFIALPGDPRYTKQFTTEPFGSGRVEQWAVGRVAGGSTSINGMVWNRGWSDDYDAWAAAGITGWDWSVVLGAFRALERHELGASELRGGDGRQPVGVVRPDPAGELWVETLRRQGVAAVPDLNSSGEERVAYVPLTVSGGERVSAARAYLHEAAGRPNVRLELRCDVRRITFDGTTATGVEAVTPDGEVRFTARREVIVCAGALASPLLLERSGVGDPRVLAEAGVAVVAENPAVGTRLRQHRGVTFVSQSPEGPGESDILPFGTSTVWAVLKSHPGAAAPDTEVTFYPFVIPGQDGAPARIGGAAVTFYPHSPTSTGSIHITGPGLDDAPRLVPGYLTTDHDRELLVAGYARVRDLLAAEPFASRAEAAGPMPEPDDVDGIVQLSLEHGSVLNHQVGGCVLGPGGAVDDDLRVRGTDRLRIADASVMPTLTTGNTAAPSMAVGWIAADRIRRTGADPR